MILFAVGDAVAAAGADGTVKGFDNTASDATPLPFTFTARIRVEYTVPFVRPVMTSGDVVTGDTEGVHVVPPSVEYSTFGVVGTFSLPAVKSTVRVALLAVNEVITGAPGRPDA